MAGRKIFITGANGFIGSYLSRYFMGRRDEVTASSRHFHPSTRQLLNECHLLELDVLNKDQLEATSVSADVIIHAATANDIISKDPVKGIELSAIGTKNTLEFALKNGVPRCIIFSTLQVYGSELSGEINESTPLNCQNDYGLNHIFAELVAELYQRQGKANCISVRPSNVYGPVLAPAFNRWSLVPGCFCKEAHETGTVTIRSSGKQVRNFVHLENVANGIDAILQHFPANYENYNLASSRTHSMIDVAEKVKKVYGLIYGKELKINITGNEPVSGNEFSIALDKLEELGFREDNSFNLESAIEQIFYYLRSN